MHPRRLRTRFNSLKPGVEEHVIEKQADQVMHHDQHAKARTFSSGQKVMVKLKTFRPGSAWFPGRGMAGSDRV